MSIETMMVSALEYPNKLDDILVGKLKNSPSHLPCFKALIFKADI